MAPAPGLCVGLGSWPDNRHAAANAEIASFGNSFIPTSLICYCTCRTSAHPATGIQEHNGESPGESTEKNLQECGQKCSLQASHYVFVRAASAQRNDAVS